MGPGALATARAAMAAHRQRAATEVPVLQAATGRVSLARTEPGAPAEGAPTAEIGPAGNTVAPVPVDSMVVVVAVAAAVPTASSLQAAAVEAGRHMWSRAAGTCTCGKGGKSRSMRA